MLPTPLRPAASFSLLDITKFFGPTTGGIRTYLLEKARYVSARPSLRQSIIVPGIEDGIEDGDGVRWYRLRGPRIPTQSPYRFMLRKRTMGRIIEHEKPDLVEVGSPYLVPWMVRRSVRALEIPLVWFYHTNFPRIISPRPGQDTWIRRTAGRLADRYVRRLRQVFFAALAASRAAVRELEHAGFERVIQVPLGVDLEHFHPRRQNHAAETRRRAGLPGGPLAMFVGRLAREKEIQLVLDAWPEVEARTGATLVLVGDGPSRQFFQQHSRARRVKWVPYQTDRNALADLMAAADVIIAPGPAETFGLAVLEALASGVPVIASDAGAVREIVEASGAGVINPEPTAAAMADTVQDLFRRDLGALGSQGRRYAEAHHGWSMALDQIFAAYRQIQVEYRNA
ncbi:MAG: glycosyltransferase [Gemmatimonadota bacterium]